MAKKCQLMGSRHLESPTRSIISLERVMASVRRKRSPSFSEIALQTLLKEVEKKNKSVFFSKLSSTTANSGENVSGNKFYFPVIFPLGTNLNPLHPGILCAKFGCIWPSGSREDENVKSLLTNGQTDDGRHEIRKAHLSFQLS